MRAEVDNQHPRFAMQKYSLHSMNSGDTQHFWTDDLVAALAAIFVANSQYDR